jgi:phosphoribosylaminoimidazole-succinocarboxamide synthase
MPSALADLQLHSTGKVREMYELDGDLLMVASDRISAYDVIMTNPIPDKGRVLTQMSLFWFESTNAICPNHFLSEDVPDEVAGRAIRVRRLEMYPIECVVRGYLSGSGWKDYLATGSVCGHPLPEGLVESQQLPRPIFTPATKAQTGHDENIDRAAAIELIGEERYDEAEATALALYELVSEHARERGIILADTKLEFGIDETGALVLGDEAFTPDSSRFWPAEEYRAGATPPSFDKQFVRDYCESLGWDKTYPGPELPDDVVDGTRARYVEAFERLTGLSFDAYLADPNVVLG